MKSFSAKAKVIRYICEKDQVVPDATVNHESKDNAYNTYRRQYGD